MFRRFSWWFCALLATFLSLPAHAQISKGHQILINRGLQLQGLCQDDCYVHLDTFTNLNYTSFCWINGANSGVPVHSSRPSWMGDAPGFLPWARWAADQTQMAPHVTPYGGDEAPYMSQLFALCLGDEWNLNDATRRTELVNWFDSVRSNYPNTILFHNNWGSQIGDNQLADFYTRAKPDMLCFDTYPWQSVYDINQPNHTGPPIAGPPTGWYGDLRRYREHARGAGIPLGLYRQTFHAVQDYDSHVFRDPSASELRLLTFAGLAFNTKFFTDFVYNTGANSLFTITFNGSGDSVIATNGLYAEMSDMNKRAINFGKALVRLTAITNEANAGYTSSILFLRGKDANGTLNALPVGFLPDPNGNYSTWTYQRNDPYLTNNWVVTNKGSKNNGNPGDVIISWFRPLDESFDGSSYSNEVYLMVVNGLTDPTGSPADCAQEIQLSFRDTVSALEVLNPTNGLVNVPSLPLTNGLRRLTLNLNGGDAVLFKFPDGAPFIGSQVVGPPVMALQPTSRTNTFGTDATFAAQASGAPPLTYRWQFNGVTIPGATMNNYTRTNVQGSDVGNYSVVVTNASGSVTSIIATLMVTSNVVYLYEPFDYPNVGGPVSANTSPNWTFGGSGANDLSVVSGSLSYTGLATPVGNSVTNGAAGLGVRRLLGTTLSNGKVYFSALFRINNLGYGSWNGVSAFAGALTAPDNTSFRCSWMLKSNTPTTYVVGLSSTGGGTVFDSTPHAASETLFLVGKYDLTVTSNAISLWINPDASAFNSTSEPPPTVTTVTATDGLSVDRFNMRQNTAVSVPAAMQWDELRFGNSWAAVTPPNQTVTLTNFTRLTDGTFQFAYTSGSSGSVYASTNLTNWTVIGTATQTAPGLYQFTDSSASNFVRRFYQVRFQ